MRTEASPRDLEGHPLIHRPQPRNGEGLPDRLRLRPGVDETGGRLLRCRDGAAKDEFALVISHSSGGRISEQPEQVVPQTAVLTSIHATLRT